jgi:hypothetical protein
MVTGKDRVSEQLGGRSPFAALVHIATKIHSERWHG